MATQLSRKRRTQPWKLAPRWEIDDVYVLTARDVVAGSFTFNLTYRPLVESVQASWEGAVQPQTEYGVSPNGRVTWPLTGGEEAGHVFSFHYQYLLGPPPPPIVPAHVGSTGYEGFNFSGIQNMTLPAGTQEDDLMILSAMCSDGVDCTDFRFDKAATAALSNGQIWIGRASTLAEVPVNFSYNGSGNTWQVASLDVIRGTEGQKAYLMDGLSHQQGTGPTGNIPEVGPGVSGGVCVFFTSDGVGGVYADQDWSRSPGWVLKSDYDYSYVEIDVALTTLSPNPAALTPNHDSTAAWHAFVFEIKPEELL